MYTQSLATLAATATETADRYGLTGLTDTELITHGEAGHLALIARHEDRLGSEITQKARAGAAPREDLESAAILGFLSALAKYDAGRGVAVYTYARYVVIRELDECNRTYSVRPVESTAHSIFWAHMKRCDYDAHLARRWSGLNHMRGTELVDLADEGDQLAEEVLHLRITAWERKGMSVDEMMRERGKGLPGAVFDSVNQTLTYTSIDAPVGDQGGEMTVADVTPDEGAAQAVADVEDQVAVRQLLTWLPDRERDVMACLHGIDTPTLTTQEVADKHSIAPSRVRAIKSAACKRLSAARLAGEL